MARIPDFHFCLPGPVSLGLFPLDLFPLDLFPLDLFPLDLFPLDLFPLGLPPRDDLHEVTYALVPLSGYPESVLDF